MNRHELSDRMDRVTNMPKTKQELEAEIREAMEANARAGERRVVNTPHSAKALSTLAMMGTSPAQWHLTPIEWIEEERDVPGPVSCPVCHGHKFVVISGGQVVPPPPENSRDSFSYRNDARRDASKANKPYGNCPRCGKQKRGWGMIPQGKVQGIIRARVMVGYPRFPSGTRFDSRFFGGMHCNLCNKIIMKSHRVPVHATGEDGIVHGMFVGEDCAQKFLDVKLRREERSILEDG